MSSFTHILHTGRWWLNFPRKYPPMLTNLMWSPSTILKPIRYYCLGKLKQCLRRNPETPECMEVLENSGVLGYEWWWKRHLKGQAGAVRWSESSSVVSDSLRPCTWTVHGLYMDCIVHGILQARILEWVAIPLSRGSSQPRDHTQVSCLAGGFFASWATKNTQKAGELFAACLCYQRQSIQNSSQRQSIRNTDFVEKLNKAAA